MLLLGRGFEASRSLVLDDVLAVPLYFETEGGSLQARVILLFMFFLGGGCIDIAPPPIKLLEKDVVTLGHLLDVLFYFVELTGELGGGVVDDAMSVLADEKRLAF